MSYRFSPWRVLMECALPAPWPVLVGQQDAEVFVSEVVRDLLRIMADATLSPPRRAAAFAAVLGRVADVGRVTDLLLGDRACRLTPARRQRFAAALASYVGRAYDGRLRSGSAEDFTLLGSTAAKLDEAVVRFTIRDARAFAPIQMSWRVLRSVGGWRLIDLEYRGIWLVDARRSRGRQRKGETSRCRAGS